MEGYTYLQETIAQMDNNEQNNTPAQKTAIDKFNTELDEAVAQGVDPSTIVKMASIMSMLVNRGITPELLQKHHILVGQLCIITGCDTSDANIDHIVMRIRNADY